MEKKYELTDETLELELFGRTLHRIRALKDFGNVKKGDLGGFVESENNLSQEGNCWVYDEAKVFNNAKVYEDAVVGGEACVCVEMLRCMVELGFVRMLLYMEMLKCMEMLQLQKQFVEILKYLLLDIFQYYGI